MAVLPSATGAVTLADYAKTLDPNGSISRVIEMLNQTNEVLTDMTWVEGNLPTGHLTTIRTGLPTPTWRKLYQGVPPTKSDRAQVTETIGQLESRSFIDVDLAELGGNAASLRLSEGKANMEGMNQEFVRTLFYGDTAVKPETFNGFAQRYSSLTSANIGKNILDAGGVGSDNTSVWLVVWGPETVTGIYPKGSQAGLTHQDLGENDHTDENGNKYRVYEDLWKWKCGIAVRDWRYIVRIANIDVSDMFSASSTQALTASTNILKLTRRALDLIPSAGMGKAAFYANRSVKSAISIMAMDKSQNAVTIEPSTNQFNQAAPGVVNNGTTMMWGIPVRTCDKLLLTEARVV